MKTDKNPTIESIKIENHLRGVQSMYVLSKFDKATGELRIEIRESYSTTYPQYAHGSMTVTALRLGDIVVYSPNKG